MIFRYTLKYIELLREIFPSDELIVFTVYINSRSNRRTQYIPRYSNNPVYRTSVYGDDLDIMYHAEQNGLPNIMNRYCSVMTE